MSPKLKAAPRVQAKGKGRIAAERKRGSCARRIKLNAEAQERESEQFRTPRAKPNNANVTAALNSDPELPKHKWQINREREREKTRCC